MAVPVWSSAAADFWVVMDGLLRRASRFPALPGGNVTPDKAKGPQQQTVSPSAPTTSLTGAGVDNKYSR